MPLLGHEAGIEQDAEVLRVRPAGSSGNVPEARPTERAVSIGEALHPAPCRMADCCEDFGLAIGNHHHAANIRKRLLTCEAELSFAKGIGRVGPTIRPQPVAA